MAAEGISRIARQQFLPDIIVKRLKEMIAAGELRPGEALPSETDLAQSFGVARPTIREAKKVLSLIGLLDVQVGRGSFVHHDAVRRLDVARVFDQSTISMIEIYEGRAVLEGGIVALAARYATADDLADMRLAVERLEAAAAADDVAAVFAADRAFHLAMARAAHNGYLYRAFEDTFEMLEKTVASISQVPDNIAHGVTLHRRILTAIEAGNARRARSLLLRHLRQSRKTVEAALA